VVRRTAEALQAKIDRKSISLQHGQFDPKFQVEGVKAVRDRICQLLL